MKRFSFLMSGRTLLMLTAVSAFGLTAVGCGNKALNRANDDKSPAAEATEAAAGERDGQKPKKAKISDSKAAAELKTAAKTLETYESLFRAVANEAGFENVTKDNLFFTAPSSEWFDYTVSDDASSCAATAKKDVGAFQEGGDLTSTWNNSEERFIHSSSRQDVAQKLIPEFFNQ
jgi:hypothetical protein